jgi:hypothetical protein
LTTRPDIYDK